MWIRISNYWCFNYVTLRLSKFLTLTADRSATRRSTALTFQSLITWPSECWINSVHLCTFFECQKHYCSAACIDSMYRYITGIMVTYPSTINLDDPGANSGQRSISVGAASAFTWKVAERVNTYFAMESWIVVQGEVNRERSLYLG